MKVWKKKKKFCVVFCVYLGKKQNEFCVVVIIIYKVSIKYEVVCFIFVGNERINFYLVNFNI